jgi:hypothetical protein
MKKASFKPLTAKQKARPKASATRATPGDFAAHLLSAPKGIFTPPRRKKSKLRRVDLT